ncbi:AGE family epimerase/isomerase [Sphingomonas sp.]|uniref:AGE family epimerase/isomerase n=1 Tax=Sphingomonas sp. TaxID=28214 RepID=UPI0025D84D1D|nr:AGE family epimerase/isomerase [Sphingomonas sp.]
MQQAILQDVFLQNALSDTREWTNGAILALIDAARDHHQGGYVERFDWSGAPLDPGFKRIRVTGRQTYVFSHAAIGGVVGADEAASHGAMFLKCRCLRADGQFASRLATSGAMLDATADLYDIAFGLFALAWWHRLSGDAQAVDIAEASLAQLFDTMRSPSGHGFVARAGDFGRHEQNPHMHLFEAAIFLSAFTGSRKARMLAEELFDLARSCLYDPSTGTLAEFFDAEWRPDAHSGPIRVEPGHHYEWVWLLCRYGQLAGEPEAFAIADRLFAFAHAHGHDPATGLIRDAVDPVGNVLGSDLRIWPNTEYLKAQVAMRERFGEGLGYDDAALTANLLRIFRHFLTPRGTGPAAHLPDGLWIDYLEHPSLEPKCDHVPASTMYHIMFGFAEVLRHTGGHGPFSGNPW